MKGNPQAILKVGSRSSPLARVQVVEVFALLAKVGQRLKHELITFETAGDQDKTTSLLTNPADDFFSNTLDEALLAGAIDVTIHSAKDLPKKLQPGLKIWALTQTLDDTDAFVGRQDPAALPPASRIGTSSLLRKEQILAINPKARITDIRGTIQERLKLLDEGKIDGLIVATCALKRLGLQKRIKSVLPWEGTPLQGQLAVVGREKDEALEKIFAKIDVRKKYGKVYLVGAGPGDPELITIKAVEALKKADIVFYDFLVHKNILDHAVGAQKVNVGKRKGHATLPQAELSRLLKDAVMSGKTVVRLKGGDPLIFGRGADEIEYLRSYHIEVEVIPGITSATGIPSSHGIPLTARGISSSVAFLSGHGEDEKHDHREKLQIPEAETLVFLMGLTKLSEIVNSLREKNWPSTTPVAVISKGTCVDEKIIVGDLASIEDKVRLEKVTHPALILVGKTVAFKADPVPAKTILYLGTYPEKYKKLGRVIHFPMISISPAKVEKPKIFLAELKEAGMILLTSRCGAKYFFEFLASKKFPVESLRTKTFVVIGADTEKQLRLYGFSAQLVAQDETSEGLFRAMKKTFKLKGQKIIFPRSALSNPYLKEHLSKAGAAIKEFIVYENTKPAKRDLPDENIDEVIFTSPSTLNNFLADYGAIPQNWAIFAKGKRTQRELNKAGYSTVRLVSD